MSLTEAAIHVRPLSPADAARYQTLRLRGLREYPLAFEPSASEESSLTTDDVRARLTPSADKHTWGCFADDNDRLLGIVTLVRESRTKVRHKAWVTGVFVAPEHRRCGIARALLQAAIDQARTMPGLLQLHLGVGESSTAARALYTDLGFEAYAQIPDYLQHDGRLHDEILMMLRLTG